MSKLQTSFPAPVRPVCILDRTWDDGTWGWNEELKEQHANFMQMNVYFESTAWVLFLGGPRQQESKRRTGGGSVSLGAVRSVWGLQSEQSCLQLTVLMLLDPLISKYETWRVKKKKSEKERGKKVPFLQ